MIMERDVAAKVVAGLIEAGSKLATSIEEIRDRVPRDEFKRYIGHVGAILTSIQLDLMAPIIKEYPDLDPDK